VDSGCGGPILGKRSLPSRERDRSWSLRGLDFLFIASFVFGLYAMHRLLAVREEGEVEEDIVKGQFYAEVRKGVRHVSNVAGLRYLMYFPYSVVRRIGSMTFGGPDDPEEGD
jgi:hypothetical protein